MDTWRNCSRGVTFRALSSGNADNAIMDPFLGSRLDFVPPRREDCSRLPRGRTPIFLFNRRWTQWQHQKPAAPSIAVLLSQLARLILWPAVQDLKGIRKLAIVERGPISALPLHLLRLPSVAWRRRILVWFDESFIGRVLPGLDPLLPSGFEAEPQHDVGAKELSALCNRRPGELGGSSSMFLGAAHLVARQRRVHCAKSITAFCSVPQTRALAEAIYSAVNLKQPSTSNGWLRAGPDATKEQVLSDERLSSSRIVLFATHGLVATQSFLAAGLKQPALV